MTIDSQAQIDTIIAGNGIYPGDEHFAGGPIVRIVQYTNAWGKRTHGAVYAAEAYQGKLYRYDRETEHIRNPVVVWTRDIPPAPARAS